MQQAASLDFGGPVHVAEDNDCFVVPVVPEHETLLEKAEATA